MDTVLKAADAADFLACVPLLAGFRPHDSLALVAFHGPRSLGVLRFDLPAEGRELDRHAATIIGTVCKVDAADGLAIVVYTDDPLRDADDGAAGPTPRAALVQALIGRADACGLGVKDALCVAADAWTSYLDPDAGVRPLQEIEERALDPRLPGIDVDADQSSGAFLPVVDLAAKERAARALHDLERAVRVLSGAMRAASGVDSAPDAAAPAEPLQGIDPRALAAACALDDVPELLEDALDWKDGLTPWEAALLMWCLARPALRDVALRQWCDDIDAGDAALNAQVQWEAGEEYPVAIAQRFWGEGPRPNAARLMAALDVVREVAALAPREQRPGALAAASWICWALGRSTHASRFAADALEIDPDHGLSQIVMTMVSAGHLPDWAFE